MTWWGCFKWQSGVSQWRAIVLRSSSALVQKLRRELIFSACVRRYQMDMSALSVVIHFLCPISSAAVWPKFSLTLRPRSPVAGKWKSGQVFVVSDRDDILVSRCSIQQNTLNWLSRKLTSGLYKFQSTKSQSKSRSGSSMARSMNLQHRSTDSLRGSKLNLAFDPLQPNAFISRTRAPLCEDVMGDRIPDCSDNLGWTNTVTAWRATTPRWTAEVYAQPVGRRGKVIPAIALHGRFIGYDWAV